MNLSSFYLPLFCCLSVIQAQACICDSSPVFDLLTYETAAYVIELEVLEKIPVPEELSPKPPQIEIPRPPQPIISPNYYEDFRIRIHHNYKGMGLNIHELRAWGRNTSCYWAPKSGDRFILYAEGLQTPEAKRMLVIQDACQRKLMVNSPAYEDEKQILQQIQAASDGRLTITDPRKADRPLATMKFAAGKPVGTWRLYDPFDSQNQKPLLKMVFREGSKHRTRWSRHPLSPAAERYRRRWKFIFRQ